ncbi:hypothetical protein [Stieleria neptunia]|uniref:hypothetical protein n=1 Tax=Stieleria neptunia TaxID=2527979 RepID=UPI0011A4E8B2|nr:hypothetical protein [Stieleria neptunia]
MLAIGFLTTASGLIGRRGVLRRHLTAVAEGWIASLVLGAILFVPLRSDVINLYPIGIALALVFGGWGSWLGATWFIADSRPRWLLQQVGLTLGTVLFVSSAAFFLLLCEDDGMGGDRISSEERRRLVALLRSHDPRDLDEHETGELRLQEPDLNRLAVWGLSLLPGDHRIRVSLRDERIWASASLRMPGDERFGRRLLHVACRGQFKLDGGVLSASASELSIGKIRIPKRLLRLVGPLHVTLRDVSENQNPLVDCLTSVRIEDRCAVIRYRRLERHHRLIRELLIDFGLLDDLESSTNAQIQVLIRLAERKSRRLTIEDCLSAAFCEAQSRSRRGSAVRENRGAILALGYLTGHHSLRAFLGPKTPQPSPEVRSTFRRLTLHDRRDWLHHFMVSASMRVLSSRLASHDVGLLKEEIDASGDGSGFSFADLLADRAGVVFAEHATDSEVEARAMQRRLSTRVTISDFVPDPSDLPEGLTDDDLMDRYGGVGGGGYRRLINDIDRRIDDCAGYRSGNSF